MFGEGQVNKYSPSFSGTAGVTWILPIKPAEGDVAFNADLFMTADFGGQNGEKLPGYQLANARLDWRGISGTGLDLGVYVKSSEERRVGKEFVSSCRSRGSPDH